MILVDKDIKKYISNKKLIIEHENIENINSISYDITINTFIDKPESEYSLKPNDFVIIKTLEKISLPENVIAKVEEKNSLLRMGLVVTGPCYQPGHETYCYLRVQNISNKNIVLKKGLKIAQLIFIKLENTPDIPYNLKKNASFQNEENYKGYGNYQEEYEKMIQEGK